jgi:hypothetical protein
MRLGRHLSALATTVVALGAGMWVMLAPWVLGYPEPAGGWGGQVLNDFWTGLGIVAFAGLALGLYGATLGAELRRTGVLAPSPPRRASPEAAGDGALAASNGEWAAAHALAPDAARAEDGAPLRADLDDLLVPLARVLLSDLVQRRGRQPAGGVAGQGGERP